MHQACDSFLFKSPRDASITRPLSESDAMANHISYTHIITKIYNAHTGSNSLVYNCLSNVAVGEDCRGFDVVPLLAGEGIDTMGVYEMEEIRRKSE